MICSVENNIMSQQIELIHVIIRRKHAKAFHIINIYRPPHGSIKSFKTSLSTFLETIDNNTPIILMGDLNINFLKKNEPTALPVKSLFQKCGLTLLNKTVPTRVCATSSTLIDIVTANQYAIDKIDNLNIVDMSFTDHRLTVFRYKNKKNIISTPQFKIVQNFRNMHHENIHTQIINIDTNSFILDESVDNVVEAFFTTLNTIVETIPKRKIVITDPRHPWINTHFLNVCSSRDRAKHNTVKYQNADTINHYKHLRNYCTWLSRCLKCQFLHSTLNRLSFIQNPKRAWIELHKLLPYKEPVNNSGIEDIQHNGVKYSNNIDIAGLFNSYFVNSVNELREHHFPPTDNHNSIVNTSTISYNETEFSFVNVSHKEVVSLLLKTKKTDHSIYSIPPEFLHIFSDSFANHILLIINHCIDTCEFPSQWKHSRVIPIHKKGNVKLIENYRPISLLPNVSKIAERCLYTQIYSYFEDNKLLYGRQYGFRRFHSTASCILDFTNFVSSEIDKGRHVAAVFIDFSKAFDMIDHSILLFKLRHLYGFSSSACALIKSYLSDRSQHVSINDACSFSLDVNVGVPQGSILGPLLFSIYVSDMHIYITNCGLLMFADDSTLLASNSNAYILSCKINDDLHKLVKYCKDNMLLINNAKTKCMWFTKPSVQHDLKLNDTSIECVHNFRLLGLTVDSNLKFNNQAKFILGRLNHVYSILRRYKYYLPITTLSIIFDCFAKSHTFYCLASYYDFLSKKNINKIESKLSKCGHLLINDSSCKLLVTIGFRSLENAAIHCKLALLHTIVSREQPIYLFNVLEKPQHLFHTRYAKNNFTMYRPTRSVGTKSFKYWAPILFSTFSNHMKITNHPIFKDEIRLALNKN